MRKVKILTFNKINHNIYICKNKIYIINRILMI